MQRRTLVVALLAGAALAMAQEGHPLTGSWHGEWSPSPAQKNPVVMFLQWDTKNITGTINPGRNAMPVKSASLDPANWTVRFEADGKDQAGNPVHVVVEGKLENLGSYNRTVTGTWTQGSVKAPFKMARD
jgi:hypothetical protein